MTLCRSRASPHDQIRAQNSGLATIRTGSEPRMSTSSNEDTLRVLVVDDNADFADSLSVLLRWHEYEVRTEYDARAALKIAAEFRPHAALLDLSMPGMSGFELARALRRIEETKAALLIAITGLGAAEDYARSRDVGFDHHLLKTADFEDIDRLLSGLRQAPPPASRHGGPGSESEPAS